MINFNAYVIELEEDNWYEVCVERRAQNYRS